MVSHFRSLHGWYVVALTQTIAPCMDRTCTWARSGETEFAISRVTTSYFEFEPKANRNEVFIATLSTVQVGVFLYSTCKRQARRTPSTPAIRCGGQARVESTTNKRPALFVSSYFEANPRGLKLNCTLWASKST